MKDETNKVIYWINAVKAVCMLTVYFQHTIILYGINIEGYNSQYITSYYVNGFFFISGYLLFWKRLQTPLKGWYSGGAKTMKNVFFRIAVPSVLFSLFEVYPKRVVRGGKLDIFDLFYETIGGGTYWFTSALVVAEVIIVGIMMASRSQNIWFYVICCTFLSYLGTIDNLTGLFLWNDKFLWAWGSGLTSLVFIVMGGVYWKYEKYINIRNVGIVLLIVIWALCIFIWDRDLKFTPFNRCLNIRGVFVGGLASFLLICICKKLPKVNSLQFIGINSIGFYFFSGAIPTVYSVIFKGLTGDVSLLGMFAVYLASITSSFLLVYLINHYCPFLFDLRRSHLK